MPKPDGCHLLLLRSRPWKTDRTHSILPKMGQRDCLSPVSRNFLYFCSWIEMTLSKI